LGGISPEIKKIQRALGHLAGEKNGFFKISERPLRNITAVERGRATIKKRRMVRPKNIRVGFNAFEII